MTPKTALSARRLRLGIELRKLRERAGISSTDAGRMLGTNQTQVSNIEAGRFGVSAERIRTMARNCGCDDDALINALIDMAANRQRGWWEEYRGILPSGLLDLAELEHHAKGLHAAATAHVPGLLQTAEHAREVFRQAVTPLSPPEVEHRVSFRIKRQAVIFREEPVPYRAIVHEAALRMKVGGVEIARKQLEFLLEMSEREHVTVIAIPFDVGAYPGAGQLVCYARGEVPELDTVQLDQAHGPVLLDAEDQLAKYRSLLDRMEAVALNEEDSRHLIYEIMRSL
ncbi:helix-turn-helix transcriptional regulator [Streptomyces sp. NPDC003077]|uniref:helix-turn-helix domain-containing protein n=1 Tax=Streptomyces sp. NPDC003077 TaxID=3154443 RepID=UPI0033AA3CBD